MFHKLALHKLKIKNHKVYNCILALFFFSLNTVAIANPITDENLLPGSRNWVLSKDPAHVATDATGQIKGYLSATSVNKGGRINFQVSVSPAQNFTIEVYRAGWYGGNGGRLMKTIGPIAGFTQPGCPLVEFDPQITAPGVDKSHVECNWSTSYALDVPTNWTSGIYLAKLKNANGFENGAIFVVRDDNRVADFLYKQPVTTYQAYNRYPEGAGGKSLYGDSECYKIPPKLIECPAVKVSFNRPYATFVSNYNGYAFFQTWELPLVKWLEKEGYDVVYNTDIDIHSNGGKLLNYRGFITPAHDEYWSKEMRDAVENARDSGVNLAFIGANSIYWQVRFEPASDGTPNRTMVGYKDLGTTANTDTTLDPISNKALKTDLFRSLNVNRPEQKLMGVQYVQYNAPFTPSLYTPLVVKNTSHWAYQGTGLTEGQGIPGITGYEVDTIYPNAGLTPTNTEFTILAESPFLDHNFTDRIQNSVIYKTPVGSWVFASGTMAWAWALDYDSDYSFLGDRRSLALQKVTHNILDRFLTNPSANTPPSVAITAPTNGSTFTQGSAIALAANASDVDGTVAKVEIYANNILLGTDTTAPYSFSWTGAAEGSYTLTAKAYDNNGAVSTSGAVSVTVTGTIGGGTGTSPVFGNAAGTTFTDTVTASQPLTGFKVSSGWWIDSIQGITNTGTLPAHGGTGGAPATVALNTGEYLVGISGVYGNYVGKISFVTSAGRTLGRYGTGQGGSNTNTFSYTVPVGSKIVGFTGRASGFLNAIGVIYSSSTSTNTPPSVAITAPTNGSTFTQGAAIALAVNASDADGSVAKVEAYAGNILLGTDTTSPYSFSWTGAAVGNYSLTAKAYDNIGAVSTSDAVSVTVTGALGGGTSPVFGNAGGTTFTDTVTASQSLTGLKVSSGWWIDSIQGIPNTGTLPAHGGTGGTPVTVALNAGEYLVGISGVYGNYVGKISFITSAGRTFGPYGTGQGGSNTNTFSYTVPVGYKIVGFTGRASGFLNAVGVIYRAL